MGIILFSAVIAGYEAIDRLWHPRLISYLGAVVAASLIGFVGNEAVAVFRIRVGREIQSAALIADGYHARVDGWTSLAVFIGAVGVWLGYPIVDPIVGLAITMIILRIVWESGMTVFSRLLDGVDPHILDEIRHAVSHVFGVEEVTEVRVRWLGHRLSVELNIAVQPEFSVAKGHDIATEVRHKLLHYLPVIAYITIHVDPITVSGETYHRIINHSHGNLPDHSHP